MVDELHSMERFGKRYKQWIVKRYGGEDHRLLFNVLHDIPFRWMPEVPMDENREADGRRLRRIFEEESGLALPEPWADWDASFLEVVASLAETMEDSIMHAAGDGTDSSTWFWMMLDNMGVGHCDDDWWICHSDAGSFVRNRVDDVLMRRYSDTGEGGLFPLKSPRLDQRRVQLWYQMNAYVLEKGWV